MRTTLSIDEDVLLAAKERARREHRTAGEVISDLARSALTGTSDGNDADDSDEFFGFRPLPPRGDAVSNDLIDRLRDEEAV